MSGQLHGRVFLGQMTQVNSEPMSLIQLIIKVKYLYKLGCNISRIFTNLAFLYYIEAIFTLVTNYTGIYKGTKRKG